MTVSDRPGAFYERRGGSINPTTIASGPWSPGTQNGGAVSALLVLLGELTDTQSGLVSLNTQIEIYRPVPMVALRPTVSILRNGRRLQVVHVLLSHDGVDLAHATLVRLRPIAACAQRPSSASRPTVLPPAGIERQRLLSPFFQAVDCRVTAGGFDELGPGSAWMRLETPILSGAANSTFAAAVLLADAGSGLSSIVARNAWSYPNVTLSLHMHRAIGGEWLHLSSETATAGGAMAQVNTVLEDGCGEAGRAHQTLCLQPLAD